MLVGKFAVKDVENRAPVANIGVKKVYENTINRDYVIEMMQRAKEFGVQDMPDSVDEVSNLGMPGELITTVVDVRGQLEVKKQAMRAHGSQIAETSFFLAMPDSAFAAICSANPPCPLAA